MKYFILALNLFFLPFDLQGNSLSYSKEETIWEANRHKKQAEEKLSHANTICVYIPDFQDREHTKALIASIIASGGVTGAKEKIITVGLGLIASLMNNMYEKYCIVREDLLMAAYHYEMSAFYNQLSLHAKYKGYKNKMDEGTREFFLAIDYLTICEMFTTCIQNQDTRELVSNNIIDKRNDLIHLFKGELTYEIYEDILYFYDNLCEITSEIEEEELRNEICTYVYAAVEAISASLRSFKGYDCWPDLIEWTVEKINLLNCRRKQLML